MSSSAANPQHEPTMEEILASIRKIISEDSPEGAKPAPASPPTSLRTVPTETAPATSPATTAASADLDVLDLTEEVAEEEEEEKTPPAKPPIHDDIAFEDDDSSQSEPAPSPVAAAAEPSPEDDDLISSSTRSLVGRAFANMDKGPVKYAPPSGGTLDAIFVQAVQSAFQPTLKDWVDGHKPEILESLKPLIRAWMDEHLPPLIEAAVAKEISRAASTRKR